MRGPAVTVASVLAGALLCTAQQGAAQAAGLDPPAHSVHDWTGPYLGAHTGLISGSTRGLSPVNNAAGYDSEPSGVAGGLLGGYNLQIRNLVFGAEADISFSDAGDGIDHFNRAGAARVEIDEMFSVRGRLGYAFDTTLLYLTGGVAWANLDYNVPSVPGAGRETFRGYQVGGGVEHMLNDVLSVRAEYLYGDFGRETVQGFTGPIRQPLSTHTFRAGVAYHFGDILSGERATALGASDAEVHQWTGFYVGAHAGALSGAAAGTYPALAPINLDSEPSGVAGGLLGGYVHQFGNIVAGIEADVTFSDAGDGVDNAAPTATVQLDHMYSLRGRLGYAMDTTLLYLTGGLAWAHVDYRTGATGLSESQGFHGYQVGGGVEHMLGDAFSLRLEYLYADFADEVINGTPGLSVSQSLETHTFRAAVAYHLGDVFTEGQADSVSAANFPAHDWTGLYTGAHAGIVSGSTRGVSPLNVASRYDSEPAGVAGGLLGGYNFQIGNVVAGVEGDYTWSDAGDSIDNFNQSATVEIEDMYSVRGRLGYAVANSLFYVTGGAVWADVRYRTPSLPITTDKRETFFGFQVGGGMEHMLNEALGLRLEYLYADFGDENVANNFPEGAVPTIPQSMSAHTMRAALIWNFGNLLDW